MFGTFLFTLTMKQTENLQLRRGEGRGGRQEGDYKKEIKSVEMELEMDCGTVQFPKLWWFLFLHLSGCEQHRRRRTRRRRRPLDSPYIINDIISTTLLTKQMHKSQRPESIDTETFNHVLNNLTTVPIIISSCWFRLTCCQGVIGARGDAKQPPSRQASCDWQWRWRRHLYVEWQLKSGCQKMQWIFAVLFISPPALNKSGGTCRGCPPAFSSAP